MTQIPARLNDGYTLSMGGCFYRRMPATHRTELFRQFGDYGEQLVEEVFREPWFFGDRDELSAAAQQQMYVQIVENPEETSLFRNLLHGARLRMKNPAAADYSCHVCRQWITDHDTWTIRNRLGTKDRMPRGDGELLCDTPGGCPRGHWQNPLALNTTNTQAWNHYWEWKQAGMPLPECPTMRRNWSVLAWVTEHGCTRELRPAIRSTVP